MRRSNFEDSSSGRRVGPYRIERTLGRGGMSTVYLAVRSDDYTQKVALKLMSWDADGEEILGRFYNERQILASLQHPMIARLLDGGTADDGRPYFIMEYVKGERIDRYCQKHQLSVRQRLRLFVHVCSAVHSAHQNLVVHRDLKPGNILVTDDGTPRLLDFGIAKVLEPELAARSVATIPGTSPMTPAYASPEQVTGEPITTACDVYALGLLLYQLLTEQLPYRFAATNYAEMIRVICLQEPKKPSSVVRQETKPPDLDETEVAVPWTDPPQPPPSRAQRRRMTRLGRRLAGDLDAIVLKAIRKEPEHRYRSAIELAEDVHRHLKGLPVAARQGNWVYTLGKFMRRNWLALAAMLLIVGLAVTTTALWRQAVEERAQAIRERTRAERVSGFLEDLFESADPDQAQGEALTVREVLDQGRRQIAIDLESEPELRAGILGTLGTVYHNLGLYGQAREMREQALRFRRIANAKDHAELAIDINNLASTLYSLRDNSAAESYFRQALAMQKRLGLGGIEIAHTMHNLASCLAQQGYHQEAERMHRQVLAIQRDLWGPESLEAAISLYSLGALAAKQGNFKKAEPLLRQALKIRIERLGLEHTGVAQLLDTLGRAHHAAGRVVEAEELYTQALDIRRKLLGDENAVVAKTKRHLALILLDQGKFEAAEGLIVEALGTYRKILPEWQTEIADAQRILGACLTARGRFEESEAQLLASYQALIDAEGARTPLTQEVLEEIVDLYERWGRAAEASRYRDLREPGQA